MGLVICRDCDAEVSSRATNCPHCGCPTFSAQAARFMGSFIRITVGVIIGVVLLVTAVRFADAYLKAEQKAQQAQQVESAP